MKELNPYIRKIRKFAKRFIAYTIEGEEKVYRLKKTPFCVKKKYTSMYHQELEELPVVPQKVVFDNYMGKGYGCNGKYVTQELLKQTDDLDIVWIVQNASTQKTKFPDRVRLVEYGSKDAMKEYATAGIWVQNYQLVHYLNQGLLKKPEQTYIQMWHGSFGIKKIENDCGNLTQDRNWMVLAEKNSDYTDYWIANSTFEADIYKRAFWNVKDTQICMYGHPRNDIFFHNRWIAARNAVETYISKKNKKILLYVPTFRDDAMEWEHQIDYNRLKQSLEQRFSDEWIILVRMHPRMKAYAKKLIPQEPYCVDVTEYPDIQELLAAADAVVTDYSSAVFDFLLTGKPAFIYAPDHQRYEKMRGLYYPLEDTPFPIAADNAELAADIASFNEEDYQKKAAAFLKHKGSVEDGDAAKRVAGLITDCIKEKRKQG